MEMQKVKENAEMNKAYIIMALMALCVILVPLIAYSVGGWYTYWGHALLAIIFGILAVLLRTRYYWEEE